LGFDTMCTKRVGGVLVGVKMDDLVEGREGSVDVEDTMKRFEERLQESEREGVKVSYYHLAGFC
jgi:hypothetical protein